MDGTYYEQDTEVSLLIQFLKRLGNRQVIDIGAERGNFVQALLESGAESVYAVEPYPPNVAILNQRFGHLSNVHILDMALGDTDQPVVLHVVQDKTGKHTDSFHSIVAIHETPMLKPVGELSVQCQTLDTLVAEGLIPSEVGILKIDAERSDFAVLRGMGELKAGVIMVEFWDDLPETVGETPYQLGDVTGFMQARGFSNYVVITRHDEFETAQMNSSETRPGDWGNVLFIHDSVFGELAASVYTTMQKVQARLLDKTMMYHQECQNRQVVIDDLAAHLGANQAAIDDLTAHLETRQAAIDDLTTHLKARQAVIDDLTIHLKARQEVIDGLMKSTRRR